MSEWEAEAENWVRWARTPGHDPYWYYRDDFFAQMVPLPRRATLDLGCGEGRVARDLMTAGHRVIAVDSSPTLIRSAKEADHEGRYILADARWLPFSDDSFDVVVAYNSLIDVEDMARTVAEAARVLEPGGHLCVSVTHPLSDAGSFEGTEPDSPFVISGSYLGRRRFEGTFERDGLVMTFRGWCYPLQDYAIALEEAGFVIVRVRESEASDAAISRFGPSMFRWRRLPMFLQLLARKDFPRSVS